MLPRLEAEEDLRLVSAVAAGTGSFKNAADHRRYLGLLARATRPSGPARSTSELQALGVKVIREPKRG